VTRGTRPCRTAFLRCETNVTVTIDTSSADGAVVTFATPTASDTVDPAPTVTCSHSSGDTFPLGTTTVTCTAEDASGNARTATFTVTVRTLSQVTAALAATVDAADLPSGTSDALHASLDAAAASFERGSTTAGANQLKAFQNKVEAQSGKHIDAETATALVAAAQRLIDAAAR
jgi:hypothetical protein